MSRLVLHIGHAKTGTTSIQSFLRKYQRTLESHGILFPRSRVMALTHNVLLPLIMDSEKIPVSVLSRISLDPKQALEIAEREWNVILGQCKKSQAKTVIISTENLFCILEPHEASQLRAMMKNLGAEITVFSYIRSPAQMYMSYVQQELKWSSTFGRPGKMHIRETLESYKSVSDTPLLVRPFEKRSMVDSDVVSDFLATVAPDFTEFKKWEAPPRKNETLSVEAMSVLKRFAAFNRSERIGPSAAIQRRMKAIVQEIDSTLEGFKRPVLRPEIVEHLARCNPDLLWLRDRYGIVFEDVDYSIVDTRSELDDCSVTSLDQVVCEMDQSREDQLTWLAMQKLAENQTEPPGRPWLHRIERGWKRLAGRV